MPIEWAEAILQPPLPTQANNSKLLKQLTTQIHPSNTNSLSDDRRSDDSSGELGSRFPGEDVFLVGNYPFASTKVLTGQELEKYTAEHLSNEK